MIVAATTAILCGYTIVCLRNIHMYAFQYLILFVCFIPHKPPHAHKQTILRGLTETIKNPLIYQWIKAWGEWAHQKDKVTGFWSWSSSSSTSLGGEQDDTCTHWGKGHIMTREEASEHQLTSPSILYFLELLLLLLLNTLNTVFIKIIPRNVYAPPHSQSVQIQTHRRAMEMDVLITLWLCLPFHKERDQSLM